MTRVCLHCVLARALRAESARLHEAGISIVVGHTDAVLLPQLGSTLYRELRGLLHAAGEVATGGTLKLTVLALPGKSHVEVTAAVRTAERARVLKRAFARHVEGTLERGFPETLAFV
jgi:hypothetical protein